MKVLLSLSSRYNHSMKQENKYIPIEIRIKKGARKDLSRPKSTPEENKKALMNNIYE